MNVFTIQSYEEFQSTIDAYGEIFIYRGVSKSNFELIPKMGRYIEADKSRDSSLLNILTLQRLSLIGETEKKLLDAFKRYARPYLSFQPKDDWEWLAVAQHHGLPTRLLDWTRNPLVAAFFAVETHFKDDGAIYVNKESEYVVTDNQPDPYQISTTVRYLPSHLTKSIAAQSGIFTIHPDLKIPYDSADLDKLIITKDTKCTLKTKLAKYGIHRASLFPDLDGLCAYLRWLSGYEA